MVCFRTATAQSPHYASRKNNTPPRAPVSQLEKKKKIKNGNKYQTKYFYKEKQQPVQHFYATIEYPSTYTYPNKPTDARRLQQAPVSNEDLSLPKTLCQKSEISKKKTLPGFVQLKYAIIFEDKTIYFSFVKRKVQKQEPDIREQKREL